MFDNGLFCSFSIFRTIRREPETLHGTGSNRRGVACGNPGIAEGLVRDKTVQP
jgi:hypothetical protein